MFGIAGDLAGAFHELYIEDKGESAERLSLYRRFQFRNLYLMAVKLEYHTGDRWCRNATSELAKEIKTHYQKLSLENIEGYLDDYVRLGQRYNMWAEKLGGPGYLLALPLDNTESL